MSDSFRARHLGVVMNDEKEKQGECTMSQSDPEGKVNLCCCYIIDTDGQYEDPCYLPVSDCCQYHR